MKRIRCICYLSVLCLLSLSGFSAAEDSVSCPLLEASLVLSPPDETAPTAETLDPRQPLFLEAPLTLSPDTETSISSGQNQELVQVPVDSVPPEASQDEEAVETIADPLEPVNRVFFHFNDKLYFWVLKPVATGYKVIIPEDGRLGVHNFFSNATTPVRLVNCLLQAKFKGAGNETARFFVNTILGLGGFFDMAKKHFKIDKQEADFGQTLGIWGMEPVFYIHWPVLGPSTLRETLGYAGDSLLDVRTYLPSRFRIFTGSTWVIDKVNETSLTLGDYESLVKAALDPYIAVREAYYHYRQNMIHK